MKSWLFQRLKFAFTRFPKRLMLLVDLNMFRYMHLPVKKWTLPFWVIIIKSIQFLELIFIIDLFEIFYVIFFGRKMKALDQIDLNLVKPYFKELNFNLVLKKKESFFGKQFGNIIYVAFNIIKYNKRLPKATLVHELMHVYQYQHFGAQYIIYALLAQKSEMAYNYGGEIALMKNEKLKDFNAEQQADLVEDYFRKNQSLHLNWADSNIETSLFQKYFNS